MKKAAKKSTFSRLIKELGANSFLLILSFVFTLVFVALSLYIPVIAGQIIDDMTEGMDIKEIIPPLVKIGVFAALSALARLASDIVNNKVTVRTVKNLRKKAYAKLSRLPVSFFDTTPKGDVISRIIADSDAVSDGLLMGMSQLSNGVITIIATLVFMLRINVKITLLVVLLTPLSLIVAALIAKSTYRLFLAQSEKRSAETAFLSESLKNLKLIKSFVREEKSASDFEKIADSHAAAAKKAIFASSLTNPSTRFVGAVIYAVIGLFGAFSVVAGALTVGGLTCFLSYAGQYSKPFNEISGVISELQNSLACAARIFELTDMEEREEKTDKKLNFKKGEVCFENVSFSYNEEKPLLTDVSFTVKAGQKAAIVGPTGCGKTTLINLLMRFYDAQSGRITVDGVDITSVTRDSLRENFGMVLQDTFLFEGGVLENITVGRPEATREEAIEAAKATHAHSFIKRLPDGYDTVLTGGGADLSEGERQLLSVTRLMLAAPPMLILDEATSSIDTMTELRINDAFAKLMDGKTTFIVAHRLSTIKNADIILVMKDGNIIETGSHESLISKGGFYKELFESQFENL